MAMAQYNRKRETSNGIVRNTSQEQKWTSYVRFVWHETAKTRSTCAGVKSSDNKQTNYSMLLKEAFITPNS